MDGRLNEWHLAQYVQERLTTEDKVEFQILQETTNILTNLVIKDMDGNEYRIQDNDARELYELLLKDMNLVHSVKYSSDYYSNSTLSLAKKN